LWISAIDFGIEQTYYQAVKRCARCGQTKPHSEFHRSNRGDGFQVWCKACRKIYDRQYCQRYKGRWQRQKNEFKRQKRQWLRDMKTDKPCADCGRIFAPEAMEWDHRPGTVKLFEISLMAGRSRKLILEEIAKCDLVCANDHAIRTRARLLESLASIGV
jgi:hypothetical protein